MAGYCHEPFHRFGACDPADLHNFTHTEIPLDLHPLILINPNPFDKDVYCFLRQLLNMQIPEQLLLILFILPAFLFQCGKLPGCLLFLYR